MLVRKATVKDVAVVGKLVFDLNACHVKYESSYRKLHGSALEECVKFTKKRLASKTNAIFVAEEGNKIVGMICIEVQKRPPLFTEKYRGYVSDLFVSPPYRRKGVSTKLFKECLKWFRSRKIKYIELTTHIQNPGSRAFWEKFGFQPTMQHRVRKI